MSVSEKSERPTAAHDRLAELDRAVGEAQQRIAAVERARRESKLEATRLKEEVVEAFAAGEDAEAGKLQKTREKAEAVANGPWPERVAGAERAATRAGAERDAFVVSNHQALVDERVPVALAAPDGIVTALRALVDAVDAYTAEVNYQARLLRPVPDLDGRDVPDLAGHLPFRVSDIRRALDEGADIPLPLPQSRKAVPAFSLDPPPPGFEALAPSGNASRPVRGRAGRLAKQQ